MGLQFCRAVHMEKTLRFPSKRQHKRLSKAWHCFPGMRRDFRQEGASASRRWGVCCLSGEGARVTSFLKDLTLFTSPVARRHTQAELGTRDLGVPLTSLPFPLSLANTCHMPLEAWV